jgi:small subunit ribosomal protein S6
MPDTKPIYDLVLLLDLGAEDDRRAKIVADARAAISAEGELLGDQAWGTRPLSYEIGHREAADYHLLQFSGPPSLIAALEHTLRITDGVIRYRVIKLPPGSTPVAASAPPVATAASEPTAVATPASEPTPVATPASEPTPAPPEDAPAAEGDPALVSA